MKWIKENDVILRVLSLLLAVVLWVYVMGAKDPTGTETISGLPVQLQGVNELSEKNLVILSGSNSNVTLSAEGTRSDLLNLMTDLSAISVTASVTHITEPGEYKVSYVAEVRGISGIRLQKRSPQQLTIVVDRISAKPVPVEIAISGTPAAEHTISDYDASPDAVTVRGPETVLRQIKKARVEYDATGINTSVQTSVSYQLLDEEGEPVESPFLTLDSPAVTLSINMKRNNAVALTVDFIDSPYLTSSMVDHTIEPSSILLAGNPEDMEAFNQISLESINLADVLDKAVQNGTVSFERMILLPNGVTAVEGQRQYATVTLTLKNCGWKTLELDQTRLAEDPVLTYPVQELQLQIFGANDVLDRIDAQQIQLIPIYDLDDLTAGQHELPCKAVTEDGSVYLKQDLYVRVEIDQEALDQARQPVDEEQNPGEPDGETPPESDEP